MLEISEARRYLREIDRKILSDSGDDGNKNQHSEKRRKNKNTILMNGR